jgi:hypothetical protein
MEDARGWRQGDVGVGLDVADPEGAAAAPSSAPNQVTGKAQVPDVVRHEGPLDAKVFDALWEIATRWEVGDNRYIVPEARKRLVAFGADVLPLLDGKVEVDQSGLELRGHVAVLQGLEQAGAKEAVGDFLRRNLASDVARRRRVALHLVGELKAKDREADVVLLLDGKDEATARRAAGVLLLLESRAGNERLRRWLAPDADERNVVAALGVLLGSEDDVWADVRPLLGDARMPVRSRLATLLAEKAKTYGARALADLGAADVTPRARRTLLDAVARGGFAPDAAAVATLARLVEDDDFGMRLDAGRTIRALAAAKDADATLLAPAVEALERRLAVETDPFVLGLRRRDPR